MGFDGENDPDDWDQRDRELAVEPLLAVIEKRFDDLIMHIGEALPRPVDSRVLEHYGRFTRNGWRMRAEEGGGGGWAFKGEYFDLTLSHPKHGWLFRQCWAGNYGTGPRGCGSVYANPTQRSTGYDFMFGLERGHVPAVEKWLGEITVFMKMGLIGPNGRKARQR